MNATMPRARPRGPNLRMYTAANTTTTKAASLATGWGESSAAAVMARAAGTGSSAMVIRCWRGSGSLTDRDATMVMTTPSNATVSGCPVARVSRNRMSREQPSAAVVRVAIRSRSSPGSEPITQLRARSYTTVIG
ncbi:hypothetical protein BN971_04905 [Mycobacterium bohemicum DSM 44277]|uniref:Uncharacterized protein n=1 Tax=Mycobacterium bohemicum DSM 44277 TaxID=1236609 RepID=A0A0U0WFM9_MYCBE|nr:hypothetical protein BN971_04905 [Mycobacterium bohemicum DSM 44277]